MPSFISSRPVAAPFKLVHMLLMQLLLLLLIAPFSLSFVEDGGKGVLAPEEVDALRDIAKELGKHDWNFTVDPCSKHPSWFTLRNTAEPTYVNQLTCHCFGGKCHVYNMGLSLSILSQWGEEQANTPCSLSWAASTWAGRVAAASSESLTWEDNKRAFVLDIADSVNLSPLKIRAQQGGVSSELKVCSSRRNFPLVCSRKMATH
ncbi:hypothetical protein Ancab_034032 [Ancistrocladus abbreviatus]